MFIGTMLAAWFFLLRPASIYTHLTNLRTIICTPGRGQFEVMPLDFVGPPSPFPWPPDFIRCPATPELPEPPFDEPPTPAGGPAIEPSDYLQKIGPHALLRVPEAAELQPEPPPCGPRCGPPFGWHIRHDLRELGVLLPPGGGK